MTKHCMVATGRSGLGLVLAMACLAGCGDTAVSGEASAISCDSEAAIAGLKQHVMRAASSSGGSDGALGDLATILRYGANASDDESGTGFRRALDEVEQIFASATLDAASVVLTVSEIVDRGQSEDGGLLCWAHLDAVLPTSATVPVSGMNEVLADQYGWQRGTFVEQTAVELFYTVQPRPRPTVSESDLSANAAMAVRNIAQLGKIAPVFLEPFNALREAEAARQTELNSAQERVTNASLAEARLLLSEADETLNAIWRGLSEATRNELQAQQRLWLRKRDALCSLQGTQYSSDPTESAIVDARCRAQEANTRAYELQQFK